MKFRPKIFLHSTQPTYPYWGGSEKFWYDNVADSRLREQFHCSVLLRDSPVTRRYGSNLAALGVEVEWIASAHPNGYPLGIMKRIGGRLKRATAFVKPHQLQNPWLERIERYRPKLAWFNLESLGAAYYTYEAVAACRENNVPYWLVIQHADEHYFLQNDEQTERLTAILQGAKRVVCISQRNRITLERAVGRTLNNIWMTTNAVTHDFLQQARGVLKENPIAQQGTARFLNLARFEPSVKGQHILFEVLSSPSWQERDWSLTLQGWGDLTGLLERLLKYYGVPEERTNLRKFTSNVLPVIAKSDLLLLPSMSEGTPFAMVEAMACGRPAVGTPVGGIPELILDNETGWLSRSTEVSDFADAMERAWTSRQRWIACGTNAQACVLASHDQSYTVTNVIAALQEDIGL